MNAAMGLGGVDMEFPDTKSWEYEEGRVLVWNEFGDPVGKPVFYYHGWPSSRLQALLADGWARDRGVRLIAMDRPGMGRSSFVEGRVLEDWPGLMVRFADFLGIGRFGQLGVSGGGPYVLVCAAMIPERLDRSAVLAGMVPLGLSRVGSKGLHWMYRVMIPLRKLPGFLFTAVFRLAAKVAVLPADRFPVSLILKSLATKDRELFKRDGELSVVLGRSFSEGVRGGGRCVMTDAEIYVRKPRFDVKGIRHPIQYWHGGQDRNIPLSLVRELVFVMRNAGLHVDANSGHFSLAMKRAGDALDYLVCDRDV